MPYESPTIRYRVYAPLVVNGARLVLLGQWLMRKGIQLQDCRRG